MQHITAALKVQKNKTQILKSGGVIRLFVRLSRFFFILFYSSLYLLYICFCFIIYCCCIFALVIKNYFISKFLQFYSKSQLVMLLLLWLYNIFFNTHFKRFNNFNSVHYVLQISCHYWVFPPSFTNSSIETYLSPPPIIIHNLTSTSVISVTLLSLYEKKKNTSYIDS